LTGVQLNGKRVYDDGPLRLGDVLVLGGFKLRIAGFGQKVQPRVDMAVSDLGNPPETSIPQSFTMEEPRQTPQGEQGFFPPGQADLPVSDSDLFRQEQQRLHQALLSALELERRDLSRVTDKQLEQEAFDCLGRLIQAQCAVPKHEQARLQASVCAEAVGLGPLEPLLADASVSEIMVNHYDRVFVEQAGRLQAHPLVFSSESALRAIIDRILAPLGRRLDISSPAVDGRLADGSRFSCGTVAHCGQGNLRDHTQVSQTTLGAGGSVADRQFVAGDGRFPATGGAATLQYSGFGWNRDRQNDFAECAQHLH